MTFDPLVDVAEGTKTLLKQWKPPRHAFVLFEKREFDLGHNHEFTRRTGLFTLNVEHRPEQTEKLFYYTGPAKKFRIIGYGNFPKLNDSSARRARVAKLYSDKEGVNPWDILEEKVRHLMNYDPDWSKNKNALEAQNVELKTENQLLAQRLSEITKEMESKRNGNNQTGKSKQADATGGS